MALKNLFCKTINYVIEELPGIFALFFIGSLLILLGRKIIEME